MVYAVLAKPTLPSCMRHSQHYPSLVCGTRNTTPPLYAVLATLPLPCMRYSQHYPSLVCGTRNTSPSCMRYSQHRVRRHSPHYLFMCCSAVLAAFSVVMRHSQLYSYHVLLSGTRHTLGCYAVLATLLFSCVVKRHSRHLVLLSGTRYTTYSCVVAVLAPRCCHALQCNTTHTFCCPSFLLGVALIGASTPQWVDQCLRMGAF